MHIPFARSHLTHEFTAFQTAENLIVLIVEAASRIANPVAHS
jgi:hypothetical protein